MEKVTAPVKPNKKLFFQHVRATAALTPENFTWRYNDDDVPVFRAGCTVKCGEITYHVIVWRVRYFRTLERHWVQVHTYEQYHANVKDDEDLEKLEHAVFFKFFRARKLIKLLLGTRRKQGK